MANPADLLPDDEAAAFVNSPPPVVATPAPAAPSAVPNTPPAPEAGTESNGQQHLKDAHRQMTAAKTTGTVSRQVQQANQNIELADPERQALRQRGFKKIEVLNDRRVVRLMDSIHRATTLDRLHEVREEAQIVMAELPDAADDISRALVERQNTINRFRVAGWALTVFTGILLATFLCASAVVTAICLVGFMAYCLIPHFYRTKRAKKFGLMVNWVRAVGKGRTLKCAALCVFIFVALNALT